MNRTLCICIICLISILQGYGSSRSSANPVSALVERIERGASRSFHFELTDVGSPEDYFEIGRKGQRVSVTGNNWISVATGLNWYLRYYANIQISWSNPTPSLKDLPIPTQSERHSTNQLLRYYLSLGSASHSTAFWTKERWQLEVDIMALHGVNMPLITLGATSLWYKTMLAAGYSQEQLIDKIPHPSYEGWWLEGLIEGYEQGAGGATSMEIVEHRAELSVAVIDMCNEWEMTPVIMGFSGFIPTELPQQDTYIDSRDRIKQGSWSGICSPDILDPASESYSILSKLYYENAEELYGKSKYYYVSGRVADSSASPRVAGDSILAAIKRSNIGAKWVVSTSNSSPKLETIDYIPRGEVIVIDSWVDVFPEWGDNSSIRARAEGFAGHSWIYSYSGNFDGNEGLYGNINRITGGYLLAKGSGASISLSGVGASIDVVGSNELLLDLIFDLPWIEDKIDMDSWLESFADARYGKQSLDIRELWHILSSTIYSPEYNSEQRGATESVFAARPALRVTSVSGRGTSKPHYNPEQLVNALRIMVDNRFELSDNKNFQRDLVAVALTVLSNYGYEELKKIEYAYSRAKREELKELTNNFLRAMLLADNLLNSQRETMLGNQIQRAMALGKNPWQRDQLRYGLKTMISSWGCKEVGSIAERHDSAHRLWGGVVAKLYAKRWAYFFNYIEQNEVLPIGYDYYDIEDSWARDTTPYPTIPQYDAVIVAQEILEFLDK